MNLSEQDRELLRQRMDACRLGSDDLSLPEMADLASALRADAALRSEWESRQRSERVIAAAMDDMSVPAGLAERILAAAGVVDRARLGKATDRAVAAAEDAGESADAPRPQRYLSLTRRQLVSIGSAALVLVAAAMIWQVWFVEPVKVSKEQLAISAQAWYQAALKPGDSLKSGNGPHPFPAAAIKGLPAGWRQVKANDERSLIVYDLSSIRGHVYLFAAKTSKEYAVGKLPYTTIPTTGGLEVGAWQAGNVIYVLVVDSDQKLEEFLRPAKLA